jgi:lactoylglutathione lyase
MEFVRTGIIIKTQNYEECTHFYSDILGLPINYEEVDAEEDFRMTHFEFGSSYLLVETGGHANPQGKDVDENPAVLRFDVTDVLQVLEHLKAKGVSAQFHKFLWGWLVIVFDPDGNQIEFKQDPPV